MDVLQMVVLLPLAAFVVGIGVDLWGIATFSQRYFRSGAPLFRRSISSGELQSIGYLEKPLARRLRSSRYSSLVFKRYSRTELGFRERMFERGFKRGALGFTHGHIEFLPADRRIVVTGRVNWAPFFFLLTILTAGIVQPKQSLSSLIVFCAMVGMFCLASGRRYRAVVEELEEIVEIGPRRPAVRAGR